MPSSAFSLGWIAAISVVLPVGCSDDPRAAATTDEASVPAKTGCAHPQIKEVSGSAVGEVETLGDFGHLGASVLVVDVATGNPIVGLNEDPAGGASFPNVFTRYAITITQLVVWPDSSPTPNVGDEMTLDVRGGTLGCFTLQVTPDAAALDPGDTYLVAAGAAGSPQLVLLDDRYAMNVSDGTITDPGPNAGLPAPLEALIGQPTTALPPLSVVESEVVQ